MIKINLILFFGSQEIEIKRELGQNPKQQPLPYLMN